MRARVLIAASARFCDASVLILIFSANAPGMLYVAVGILGATVMPHNLYLHSSIVQTRRYEETREGKKEAVKFAFIDSTIALSFALFINAAILIVAAATFHTSGHNDVAEIQDAYKLLTPLLGAGASTMSFSRSFSREWSLPSQAQSLASALVS